MSLSDGIALWLLCLLVLAGVGVVIEPRITRTLDSWLDRRKAKKRAAIEAELDRTQAELRRTILQLASAMNGDAHEARKALIRESFLTSGKPPEE